MPYMYRHTSGTSGARAACERRESGTRAPERQVSGAREAHERVGGTREPERHASGAREVCGRHASGTCATRERRVEGAGSELLAKELRSSTAKPVMHNEAAGM